LKRGGFTDTSADVANLRKKTVKKTVLALTAAAAIGAAAIIPPAQAMSANGASLGAAATAVAPGSGVEQVRWRGRWHHHRGWGPGAAIGAGILGLAAGAAIASSAPPPPVYYYGGAPYGGDAVAYCMQRCRSYDPASGTYLGYDGYRHPCP
jgi:hypothetical protein